MNRFTWLWRRFRLPRFSASAIVDTPRMRVVDNKTGKEIQVSLCDWHGAKQALTAFCGTVNVERS